jgi:DNA-binding LytR/AlgR family response regulator
MQRLRLAQFVADAWVFCAPPPSANGCFAGNRPEISPAAQRCGSQRGALARVTLPRKFLRWIKASSGSDVRLIMVDDILYFEADIKYTTVVTAGEEAIIRMSLKQLRSQLDPDAFWQIHRSTIVNVQAIRGITRGFDGSMQVLLKSRPERLTVSEASRHLFRQM